MEKMLDERYKSMNWPMRQVDILRCRRRTSLPTPNFCLTSATNLESITILPIRKRAHLLKK